MGGGGGVITKLDYFGGSFLYILVGLQIFFFGMTDIPDTFLGVNSRCWVQAYV